MDIKWNSAEKKENISVGEKSGSKPLPAGSLFGRDWDVRFDEPELTSDAGLAALVSSGIADRLLRQLAGAIDDPRKSAIHSIEQLIRQRVFLIAGGY